MGRSKSSPVVAAREAEIEALIAGADAGHRLAEHEPSEAMRENARRILRGELSADEAVREALARATGAASTRR